MSSSRAVDILNQTATGLRTSPRKRARLEDEHPPSAEIQALQAPRRRDSTNRASRKSVSQLPTPRTRSAKSLGSSNEITLHPTVSPRATRSDNAGPKLKEPKGRKRIIAKGRPVKESPFKGQDIVVDVDTGKVNFNSFNTPAKGLKKRKLNPLLVLSKVPIQHVAKSTAVKEDKINHSTPAKSPRAPSYEPLSEAEQEDDAQSVDAVTAVQEAPPDVPDVSGSQTGGDEPEGEAETSQGRREKVAQADNEDEDVTTKVAVSKKPVKLPVRSGGKGPGKPQKKRRSLTEEEIQQREERKRQQKATEQKKRAGNTEESAESALKQFEVWKLEFGTGIEKEAEEAGGLETWKTLGAGAHIIEDGAPPTTNLETEPAKNVWRELRYLHGAFLRLYEHGDYQLKDEEAASDAIDRLGVKSTVKSLRPANVIGQSGDKTVVHLYQLLIPKLIQLLKLVLQSRYVDGLSPKAIDELLALVKIGVELCTVATEWTPKPTSLPAGTRRAVHNYVNPSLRLIRAYLEERQRQDEHIARQQQIQAKLRLAQKLSRESKAKRWAERKQRFATQYSHYNSSSQPRGNNVEVVDIDDIG